MRDIRIHTETTAQTRERAVSGVTDGMIGLGQTVTFEGTHFGIRQKMEVKVIEFDRPHLFVDEMIAGRFVSFRHVHEFKTIEKTTLMRDTLVWRSPYGFLGKIVDRLLIDRHLRTLVSRRNARLKELAESEANRS